MKALCVALTLVLMMLSAAAWSMGSTLNTDFEGDFTGGVANGWEAFSVSGSAVCSAETTTLHHGAKAQKVDNTSGSEAGVKAKFDAVPGSTYAISVWVKVVSGSCYFTAMANGEENVAAADGWQELAPSADWQQITRNVTATGNAITLFLDGWAGVCIWDDITLVGDSNQFEAGAQANGVGVNWAPIESPVCSLDSTQKHTGAWSQKITTAYGLNGGVYRDFEVISGRKYLVSAWARVLSGIGYFYGGAGWTGVPVNTGWQKVNEIYTADSNTMRIYLFQGENLGGESYWDDVTITLLSDEPVLPASPYYKIYEQISELEGLSNFYYSGGVFDGKLYTGQIAQCAQLWGDEQVTVPAQTYDIFDGLEWVPASSPTETYSARVAMTQPWMPSVDPYGEDSRRIAKTSIPLGGWIYMVGGGWGLYRTQDWWTGTFQSPITTVATPFGEIPDSICTDGQYIYAATFSWTPPNRINKIYKYVVNHTTGTLTNAPGWPITVAGTGSFSGISYYQGCIYAIDGSAPFGIYQIDAATGAATKLANFVYPNGFVDDTQVVRYGNQLFITCAALECHKLYTYNLVGGVWTPTSSMEILSNDATPYPLDGYGVAVKGDGTTAQYAWVAVQGSTMQFYGLSDPWALSPADLGATTFKNAYRANVGNAVVTAIGSGGFWIENTNRTAGAHVLYTGTAPALNTIVTVKGLASKTAGGERTLTATEVTSGALANPVLKPLFTTNKNMTAFGGTGIATDGMLVTVSGKVSHYSQSGAFYIDDGSAVLSDVPNVTGVKVLNANGTAVSGVTNLNRVQSGLPSFAKITGVVRIEKLEDGTIVRTIGARDNASIVITAL